MLLSQASSQGAATSRPLSVSEAMQAAKRSLESITVKLIGEVSEVNAKAGYKAVYFTVKDAGASLPCMIWLNRYHQSGVQLCVGQRVELTGRFTLYAPKGRMNFDVFSISLAGEGDLRRRVAELAQRLEREGLMAASRKRPVGSLYEHIGLVTSPRGAAVHDVLRTIRRRFPVARISLAGVAVEGSRAPQGIVFGIDACVRAGCEVILVVRGGGSFEDLMPFNDERLARAIVACPVPIVTGIGHEPDTSIADMVADVRSSTPTAAAELATPDGPEWLRKLSRMEQALHASARHSLLRSKLKLDVYLRGKLLDAYSLLSPYSQRLDDMEETLQNAATTRVFHNTLHINKLEHQLQMRHPAHRNRERTQLLASLQAGLSHAAASRMTDLSSQLTLIQARLEAHSPEQTLRRGYALVENQDKQLIRQTNQVHAGEKLKIRVSDGCFYVRDDTPH